jgi:hypothetical protein
MHFSIKTQAAGTQNVVGDATSQGGDVVVTNASSTVRILVTGGTGYIKTDGASLQSGLGLSSTVANTYANQWISLTPRDTQFSQLAASVSLSSTLAEFTPDVKHLRLTEKPIAGHPVGLIVGTGTAAVKVQSYDIQLAVTTQTPVLPIGGVVSVHANGKSVTQVALFTRWGKPVALKPPAKAIPLSTIAKG